MAWRHVECFEVVEVGLNFRAFCNLETQSDKNVFESLCCLRDKVHATSAARCFSRHRQLSHVNAVCLNLRRKLAGTQFS